MFYIGMDKKAWSQDGYAKSSGHVSAETGALVQLQHYRALHQNNHNWGALWQLAVILGSALATLVALEQQLDPVVRALPALLATVASSIMAFFDFRTEAIRQGATAVAIEREFTLYHAGAAPYANRDKDVNGQVLATNVRAVIEGDVGLWRTKWQAQNQPTVHP